MLRWRIAILVSVAIAISYLDRQTLSVAIKEIQKDFPINNVQHAYLNSAFLITYGIMYIGGGILMDRLGTRRGFAITMVFWSLACASHSLATGIVTLAISRLLLGFGEGGGFPAATRAVAEWFPVKERSTAMGIINAGTAVGGIAALPVIGFMLLHFTFLGLSSWRWMFMACGAIGLLWTVWWLLDYQPPARHAGASADEKRLIAEGMPQEPPAAPIPILDLLRFRETWGIVLAKFLSDAAWYFIFLWLPRYLFDARGFNLKEAVSIAWIPPAAAGVGCLLGGGLSSWLLGRGYSVNASRKIALGASAAMMPLLIFVPYMNSIPAMIALFCVGYFGQQSWSTLVMILPTDFFPKRAVGTVAGFVGFGGAMGGIAMGQLAGWLLDNGYGYKPVFAIAGSLHVAAFLIILATARSIRPLMEDRPTPAFEVVTA